MGDYLIVLCGFVVGYIGTWWYRRMALMSTVRHWMNRGSYWREEAITEMRTLLALDGHRMPRRLREAVVVWLAEREGGQS